MNLIPYLKTNWRPQTTVLAICGFLITLVLLIYQQAPSCEFIALDDPAYITNNALVSKGLSWANVWSALTDVHVALWIPMTWISLMADVSMFGVSSSSVAIHGVNVLFHAANAVLVFLWLRSATGRVWPSAVVAALFAAHPINVESVLWATERKNVLCLFFTLWTLFFYTRYVKRPTKLSYVAAAVFFALSLMAKPMSITLPVFFLLLDFWPLNRMSRATVIARVREKVPFFLISYAALLVGMYAPAQLGVSVDFTTLPVATRATNAAISYVTYLRQFVWPEGLGVIYMHPMRAIWLQAGVSAAILLGFTILAVRVRRSHPYFIVGWIWFIVALLPTSGMVQVGEQARADRFTYLPQLGMFAAAVWFMASFKWTQLRPKLAGELAFAVIALLGYMTARQIVYWDNSMAVYDRALSLDPRNANLLVKASRMNYFFGDAKTAFAQAKKATECAPHFPDGWVMVGLILSDLQKPEKADEAMAYAARLDPTDAFTRAALGGIQLQAKKYREAAIDFRMATYRKPELVGPRKALDKLIKDHPEDVPARIKLKHVALSTIVPEPPSLAASPKPPAP